MGLKLIFLGAPGAGKGTQAEILSACLLYTSPIKIAQVKKDIARVKTIIREQQLAGR